MLGESWVSNVGQKWATKDMSPETFTWSKVLMLIRRLGEKGREEGLGELEILQRVVNKCLRRGGKEN